MIAHVWGEFNYQRDNAMASTLRIYELVNKKTLINLSVNQNEPEFDRLHGFHNRSLSNLMILFQTPWKLNTRHIL